MKTKQECKDEVAKKHGFYEFDNLLWTVDDSPISAEDLNTVVDEAMEMYAAQFREIKMPSEEEIDEEFFSDYDGADEEGLNDANAFRKEGIQWAKERIIKLNKA